MSKHRREERRHLKVLTENFEPVTCNSSFEDRIYDIRQERDKQQAKDERQNVIVIYTDGAYKNKQNEKSGAWAYLIARKKGKLLQPFDGEGNRENREVTKGAQPELSAIIEAMQSAFVNYPHRNINLRTDQEEVSNIATRYLKSYKDPVTGEAKRSAQRKHYIYPKEKNGLETEYKRLFDLLDEAAKRKFNFTMTHRKRCSDRCSRIVDSIAVSLNNGNNIDIPHYLANLMLDNESNRHRHGARESRNL